MSLRKILCSIDFSSESDHALRVAVRLATRDDADLVLVHAWYAGEYALAQYRFPSPAVDQLIEDEERGLAAAVRSAQSLGARRVSSALLTGYPSQEIVEALRLDPAFDLAVIGTRGRTGLSRVLLGSVAEQTMRHAPCPVLVTRERPGVTAFRRVLCAVDLSESSRDAMELATTMVDPGGAGITLLHAIELPVTYSRAIPGGDIAVAIEARAGELLEKAAAELRTMTTVPVTTVLRTGNPGAQALALLDEQPAFDLVVTGTHGRTGIRRVFLGSVAEKIVRHAPCSVLVARRREQA
ncbi:MAG TPA: universal stress protein [Kofleriaceae bacterium]|nr:universal stress protein [Kofleriaceae bacterium]